jgi:uncharacterized protein YjbJ (UPF0337 family)
MNQDIIKAKWPQLAAKLKRKWSKLTDSDLNRPEGHREYLVGKLQERYGIAKEKAVIEVKEFERALR